MTRLDKNSLIEKYKEKIDEESSIEFFEDIADSFDESDEMKSLKTELEEQQAKYDDLKEKYKNRFLEGSSYKNDEDDDNREQQLRNVIDFREI